jgi:hypothetical protein
MTWLKVELTTHTRSFSAARDQMYEARKWCEHNLSSNGVLWKHEQVVDWAVFYFAQPQDLIIFKLTFG